MDLHRRQLRALQLTILYLDRILVFGRGEMYPLRALLAKANEL